jgi:hypothetical protein
MTSLVSNEPADEHSGDPGSVGMSRRSVIRAGGVGVLAFGPGRHSGRTRLGSRGPQASRLSRIAPMTYALRVVFHALRTGSKVALASGSQISP